MASDRGVAPELSPDDLDPAWFTCDCLHISGYALLATPIDGAALQATKLARGNGARVSVDLSAWTHIREHGPVRLPGPPGGATDLQDALEAIAEGFQDR